jgi:tetratricopeptide (TPR) repeat protein
LLVLEVYPLRRRPGLRLVPFFALALATGLVGVGRYEGGLAAATHDLNLYPGLRVMLSVFGLAFYSVKTVLPAGLYPQYVWSLDPQPGDMLWIAAAVLLALVAGTAIWAWRRGWRAPATALAVYVVTLLPVLSLLRLDRQQVVSDHHSYLPGVALAGLVAAGWSLWRDRNASAAQWGAIAVLTVLAGLTVRQIGFWSDSVTLWTRTVEAYPLSITAHNDLGRAFAEQGRAPEAIEQFQAAVDLQPNYAHAQYNLGNLLMQQGQLSAAETHLRAALEREPRMAQGWSDLGNCVLRQGRAREAIEAYERALEIAPTFEDARYNLGVARQVLEQQTGAR